MKLILKYRAGLSSLNEIEPVYDKNFEKSISKLIDKKSDIHHDVDDERIEVEILNSTVHLEFESTTNQIFTIVTYSLDREPQKEEINAIIEKTSGQLTDGYGEEPWNINTSNGTVAMDLINFTKSKYLNPIEVIQLKSKPILSLKSIFTKKKCSKLIEKAVENGDLKTLKEFIDNRGNINCVGKWKQTLLMKAIQNNQEEIASYLIENKADVNKIDVDGGTALLRAIRNDCNHVIRQLLENGANVNFKSSGSIHHGITPLIAACQKNNAPIIDLLLEKGANINIFSDNGESVLMSTEDVEIIKFLLSRGANPESRNARNMNAMESLNESIKWSEEMNNDEWWGKNKTGGSEESINTQKEVLKILEEYTKHNNGYN